jgi:hypothetical protein
MLFSIEVTQGKIGYLSTIINPGCGSVRWNKKQNSREREEKPSSLIGHATAANAQPPPPHPGPSPFAGL